jgi:hypothetical protein
MTPIQDHEFRVLRDTIAWRGTVRMVLVPVSVFGWAFVAIGSPPAAIPSLLALAVLVAGFEAVHALHVGVERIGRYVQVFYEENGGGPSWEQTAMRIGPGLPGGGVDPLFTAVFAGAAILNALRVVWSPLTNWHLLAIALHALFIVRLVRAKRAAAGQRAVDLETFTAIRATLPRQHTATSDDRRPGI